MPNYIEDPALLEQLNGKPSGKQYVQDPALLKQLDAPATPAKKGYLEQVGDSIKQQFLADVDKAKGGLVGLADIGDTALNMAAKLPGVPESWKQANRSRHAETEHIIEQNKDNPSFNGGRVVSNIAATYPVGGVVGKGVKAVAPVIARLFPGAVPTVEALADAISTGGFKGGNLAPVANPGTIGKIFNGVTNAAVRSAGGAIASGTSAALLNPADAGQGAAIGAVLPPAVQVVGKVGGAIGKGYHALRTSKEANQAGKLADYLGVPETELQAALKQEGPQMIPGYRMTVPQIVQTPEASQLQRTLKTAGNNALGDAEAVQQAQFRDAINRVAKPGLNVNDAANRAGHAIQDFAIPERQLASKNVRDAFDAVDPFDESALNLPINEMKTAKDRFLGPGTFGTGSRAQQAIDTAEQVGTETIDAIKPASAKGVQDLVQAVRAAGGINTTSKSGRELAGEIRNLRESGLNNLVRPGKGQSIERMAEQMHEAGYLPDDDPATLLNLLHESAAGNPVYAQGSDDAYRAMMEATQGPPPGAETFAKTAPFQTIQNLRSSIGEAAEQAEAKGANKEAAALKQMIAEIDSRINRAAGDAVELGEYFPKDMADRYRHALKLHSDKMKQFETGPQAGMFRKGADGQPAIQGAEIPGKFYNGNRSQVEDVQALKRLIGNRDDLLAEMKRYAVTEGLSTRSKMGNLGQSYRDWLESRYGANRELFNDQELATLNEVGKAVERQIRAEELGRVSGPDTAQKLQSLTSLGLLDNKKLGALSHKIPLGNTVLNWLRESAAKNQRNTWGQLLANPEQFASALAEKNQQEMAAQALRQMLDRLGDVPGVQAIPRAAPLLSSDR
jgi:hypothetical protein